MMFRDDFRRLLRAGGFAVWAVVGLPVFAFQLPRLSASREPLPLAAWAAAYLLFGIAFGLATSRRAGREGNGSLLLAAGQAAAVIALVALPPCFGLEGALLVLVALQLGGRLAPGAALSWIAVQTALLFVTVWLHWGWHWAVVLTGAYLPFQVIAYMTVRLLAEETVARTRLAAANAELEATRELLVQSSRVAERGRIARDLHDLLGHHLTALSLNLEIASHVARGEARERVETAQSVTKLLLGDVREAVGRLRQGEGLELAPALGKLAEGFTRPRVHLEIEAGLAIEDPAAGEALLRCAQEILTNAVRHAGAENLWLEVAREGEGVAIHARDDGRGAADFRSGHGLTGMRERIEQRGGTLRVETTPGQGFSIRAVLPSTGYPT